MKVLLFGMIAEKAGSQAIDCAAGSTVELRRELERRIAGLSDVSYAIAVDRRVVKEDLLLTGEEEVALLPPFAGG